jgi:hypothetical protein
VEFGQIAMLLIDFGGGNQEANLSTVAMDTASVLKERGHKNGHNRLFLRVPGSYGVALSC